MSPVEKVTPRLPPATMSALVGVDRRGRRAGRPWRSSAGRAGWTCGRGSWRGTPETASGVGSCAKPCCACGLGDAGRRGRAVARCWSPTAHLRRASVRLSDGLHLRERRDAGDRRGARRRTRRRPHRSGDRPRRRPASPTCPARCRRPPGSSVESRRAITRSMPGQHAVLEHPEHLTGERRGRDALGDGRGRCTSLAGGELGDRVGDRAVPARERPSALRSRVPPSTRAVGTASARLVRRATRRPRGCGRLIMCFLSTPAAPSPPANCMGTQSDVTESAVGCPRHSAQVSPRLMW